MPNPSTQVAPSESAIPKEAMTKTSHKADEKRSLPASLGGYAMVGGAAALLLALVEWIDTNIQLAPVFESFSERLIFSAYLSLNLMGGALIGLLIGLFTHTALLLKGAAERVLSSEGEVQHKIFLLTARRTVTGFGIAALAAFLLNQQPTVNRYVIAVIREAEKISFLKDPLLNHERSTSYLILMGLVIACWAVWKVTRASNSLGRWPRAVWLAGLIILMAAAYYIDSRLEVQLYEQTLHRSLFLLDFALAMAFAATIYFSWPGLHSSWFKAGAGMRRGLVIGAIVVVMGLVAFTFFHFDRNHNLKTQIFYRTTQAKQHFKLFQWILDFDRDGYSTFLGGGDPNDWQASINPGQPEVIEDGIDNNSIGGDLTRQDIEEWKRERELLYTPPDHPARPFNVIFIFIDTLRADHLSAYGYHRSTTPNIDKLAARSSLFENAYTPAPNTFEALPKFMQSSHWDGHFPAWTEVLARNGYHTILFPGRLPTMLRHLKGIKEVVHKRPKSLERKIDLIIERLSLLPPDRPFFAYVYSSDPHRPYKKYDEFDYGSSLTDLYDGEIAYTDSQMGRVFDWLEESGRINDTVVVLMSDHGESLGERGMYKHSRQLYNEQAQVPMIVYVPGLAPRRVPDYVSTIDLGTTILSAVGLEPPKEYAGVNLLPLMRGQPFTHPPVYAEQTSSEPSPFVRPHQQVNPEGKKYMVITQDGYKLIYNRNFYTFELYDLKQDRGEERNLYNSQPERAESLKKLLGRFIDIVLASRPWDADENQYSFGPTEDEEDEK
ncbi:MAG: sulfatase-like hydrolase/transferase [Blastocatellia bacterium]|nr:sulfatase-like hydrolase/transferase [Blastocatellia bacterium]